MSKIFISYRRDDSAGYAQAIYRELVRRFSKDQVFMDVDTVQPGVDFVRAIEGAVSGCDVLLAVIGKRWANVDNSAPSRLDDPDDFVRLEISTALARDIRVIPVLVEGMPMPKVETLPTPLKALTRRNAMEISHTRFEYDVERVVSAVRLTLGQRQDAPDDETGLLERLGRQMLVARTSGELRQLLYELEAYLANYPHSPEARLLKDKMQAAMRREEAMESPRASVPAERAPALSPLRWLIVLAALAVILYAILVILGFLPSV
jgi:TIR domain